MEGTALTALSTAVTNWITVLFGGMEGALTEFTGNEILAVFAIGIPVVGFALSYLGGIIGKRLKARGGRRR